MKITERTCCKLCGLAHMNGVEHTCDPEGIKKREEFVLSSEEEKKCHICGIPQKERGGEFCSAGHGNLSSPTWQEKEREAWKDAYRSEIEDDLGNLSMDKIADYWISRMESARAEAYHQGIHEGDLAVLKNYNQALREECSELVEIIKGVGRNQTLETITDTITKIPETKPELESDIYDSGLHDMKVNVLATIRSLKK